MSRFSSNWARPINNLQADFLEALVTEFKLVRKGGGVVLKLDLNSDCLAIWQREAKAHIQSRIPRFTQRTRELQAALDAILLSGAPGRLFSDERFPFRYVSGGTLPVVRFLNGDDREYYCLIYREVFPVGWNIANGGADSVSELLNPFRVVERELREELVILSEDLQTLYVFEYESGRPELRPEYAAARVLWQDVPSIRKRCPLELLNEQLVPVRWLSGPDSLALSFDGASASCLDGFFLNINAEDFGIEVDRIASLGLPSNVVLYDGELLGSSRVASLIGLFEVDRMQKAIEMDAHEFLPDIFFYECKRYEDPKQFRTKVKEFVTTMTKRRHPEWDRSEWDRREPKYDLCPVTRRLILRHMQLAGEPRSWGPEKPGESAVAGGADVFISFAHEDERLARRVASYIGRQLGKNVFLSCEQWHADYAKAINEALEDADCFVAVASDPNHLRRNWVEFESRAFHVLMASGRKSRHARMLSYIDGFAPHGLPLPLLTYQAIKHNKKAPYRSLKHMLAFVDQSRQHR